MLFLRKRAAYAALTSTWKTGNDRRQFSLVPSSKVDVRSQTDTCKSQLSSWMRSHTCILP